MPRKVNKETAEVLRALGKVSVVIAQELKDGFQPTSDVPNIGAKLMLNPEYRNALSEAADGIQKIPQELRDGGARGGIGTGIVALETTDEVLEALGVE